jgi:hypothetical protein
LRQRVSADIRDAIRLTALVEFVDSHHLPEGAPLIDDRRAFD